MLANFLLSPPGLLKINNASTFFPGWLSAAYTSLYESSASAPAITTESVATKSLSSDLADDPQFSPPELPPFPTSISDLVADRIQLNRLLGLSNLYYIDPEDLEIKMS